MWSKNPDFRGVLQPCEVKPPGGRRDSGRRLKKSESAGWARRAGTKYTLKIWVGSSGRRLGALKKIVLSLGSAGRCQREGAVGSDSESAAVSDWSHVCGRSCVPKLCTVVMYQQLYLKDVIKDSSKTTKKTRTRLFSFIYNTFLQSVDRIKETFVFVAWVLDTALREIFLFGRFLSFSLLL